MAERIPTREMENEIRRADSIARFVGEHEGDYLLASAAELLNELIGKSGEGKSAVIRKSQIEQSYAYAILRGDRRPGRDRLLQFALALSLSPEETQKLLRGCGMGALYTKYKRDSVLYYCLVNKKSVQEAEESLSELGLPLFE